MTGAFTGILALGLILVPGFSYRIGREFGGEADHAGKRPLGFRETALLIVPGFIATFAGLCVFAAVRAIAPSHTPDIGEIANDPGEYLSSHLPYLFWWSAFVLAVSSVLALAGGWCVAQVLERSGRVARSSWRDWLEHPRGDTYVHCYLTDGSVVSGFLLSYNEDYEETQDRDLCLLDPWHFPSADSDERVEWEDDIAIISAARIQFLMTSSLSEYDAEREEEEPVEQATN